MHIYRLYVYVSDFETPIFYDQCVILERSSCDQMAYLLMDVGGGRRLVMIGLGYTVNSVQQLNKQRPTTEHKYAAWGELDEIRTILG